MSQSIPRKYLVINSNDRQFGDSPSQFLISLSLAIKCSKCKLIEASIPNSYYNITNSNNGIIFNGTLYNIPPGSYDLPQVLAQLQATCSIISTLVFDDINCNITITTPTHSTLSFPTTGSLNFVLGFPSYYNKAGTTFIGNNSPSIDQFNVYIEIDELSNSMITSNFRNSTFVISNNVNKNGIMYYYQKSQFEQSIAPRVPDYPIQSLHITVKDIYGNILIGLSEWNMVLELS